MTGVRSASACRCRSGARVSSSSDETSTSSAPGTGFRLKHRPRAAELASRHREDLDVVGGRAGALRDAGDRRALRRDSRRGAPPRPATRSSTPPPSPPSAQIRSDDRSDVAACSCASLRGCSAARAARRATRARASALVPLRVADHLGAVEATGTASPRARSRRTGRSRRSRRSPSRPGRPSADRGLSLSVSVGQPDSRMQEWSPLQTSSSTPYFTRTHALALASSMSRDPRLDAALALELALALGDDHLEAREVAGEGLARASRASASTW